MAQVLHLVRKLTEPPQAVDVPGVGLRNYRGPGDISVWLTLRELAFARERLGVGSWQEGDFRREFLEKPWWRPERQWFAYVLPEAGLGMGSEKVIGTITWADRGRPPVVQGAVHWLAVLPICRRLGVARQLLAQVEKSCWDSGLREIVVETHVAWERAVAFYASAGYCPVSGPLIRP